MLLGVELAVKRGRGLVVAAIVITGKESTNLIATQFLYVL
jgi:hypothetical protein